MLTQLEYEIVWGSYIAAALVMMLIVAKITSFLPSALSSLLRVFALVLLFTPWFVDKSEQVLAPAITIVAFDHVIRDHSEPLRALVPLIVVSFAACLLLLVWQIIVSRFRKNN